MTIRLLRNPFRRSVVANSAPEVQDDTRLAEVNAERQVLELVTQEVADFKLSLIRAETIRTTTQAYNKAVAELAEAKRLHRPTAHLQARVGKLNADLLAIDLEANRNG